MIVAPERPATPRASRVRAALDLLLTFVAGATKLTGEVVRRAVADNSSRDLATTPAAVEGSRSVQSSHPRLRSSGSSRASSLPRPQSTTRRAYPGPRRDQDRRT